MPKNLLVNGTTFSPQICVTKTRKHMKTSYKPFLMALVSRSLPGFVLAIVSMGHDEKEVD